MATRAELELREILLMTGLMQPLRTTGKPTRVTALCRMVPGQEKQWLSAVNAILVLTKAAESGIEFQLGTQFILKDDVMVKGWLVVIDAKTAAYLKKGLQILREALAGFEPVLVAEPAPAAQSPAPAASRPVHQESVENDPDVQKERLRAHTKARPRRPVQEGEVRDPPPPREPPLVKVVATGRMKDSKGRMVPVVVQEFPLPHVNVDDMNRPNAKGRGVTTL